MRRRRRDAADFADEIDAHLALEVEQLISEGLSPADARVTALRRFGNVTASHERFYESTHLVWLGQLWHDVRTASRSALRDRAVIAVAILSLALSIGATTAVASLADAVLFQPLPYPKPERLVTVWEDMSSRGFPRNTPSPANYFDWRERSRVFEELAATLPSRANLTGDGPPERVSGRRVTASFFTVLGVSAVIGRGFSAEEDQSAAPVVVISHALWQRRYGGDPAVLGRQLLMNDRPTTVIGVMPASFVFRDREMDFWTPISFGPSQRSLRAAHILNVVGRLRPGVTLDVARADMDAVAADLARTHPANADVGVTLVPIREDAYGDTRQQVSVLAAAAGCLLLLMSANFANLLLARAAARRRELATRAALGAARLRLATQMVAEGLLWAICGGALGIVVAVTGLTVLEALIPVSLSAAVAPRLDGRLLTIALGISLLTGIGFSLIPALRVSQIRPQEVLKDTSAGLGGAWRTRAVLITTQIALSVALVAGTALIVQSLANVRGLVVEIKHVVH